MYIIVTCEIYDNLGYVCCIDKYMLFYETLF